MAKYNFILAKQIINSTKNLSSASLGMKEDWFWTAGINGSDWATPILHLKFNDGSEKWFECFEGMLGDSIERIEKEMMWASGCLSGPVQEFMERIKVEKIVKLN